MYWMFSSLLFLTGFCGVYTNNSGTGTKVINHCPPPSSGGPGSALIIYVPVCTSTSVHNNVEIISEPDCRMLCVLYSTCLPTVHM
jgi:hypothetical protein